MIHFILKKLRIFFLFLSLSPLCLSASMIPIDPCHDPLEIAALFSNMQEPKNTLESQIEKKEKQWEKYEKAVKNLKEGYDEDSGIKAYTDNLALSLNGDDLDLRQKCHASAGSEVIKVWASRGRGGAGAECNFSLPDPADKNKKIEHTGTLQKKKERARKVAEELVSYMAESKDEWGCDKKDYDENYLNDCRKWQAESDNNELETRYFDSDGKIYKAFCADYADNPGDCQQALDDLKEIYDKVEEREKIKARLKSDIRALKEQQSEKELSGESEEQHAGPQPCWDCVERYRDLNSPGFGEIAGNTLLTALGVGLSVVGVREGRRAQTRANEMLALQGMPAQNHLGYSLAGASIGFPFIQNGIAGLTQSNASRGGYGCSHTASHHASMHPMMRQQMMMQQQMMMMQGGANPFAMSPYGNPMAQFQMNNPFGMQSPYGNPMAQFQMNNPFGMQSPYGNPMAQFQMNNPFGMQSPYGNPMAQFQMNNPFGMQSPYGNPMAQFQMNNPFGMQSPYGNSMMPGMNPMYSTQYSQQAMQQMQMQMQIQQAVAAQQQSVMQDQMQRRVVIGGLMQEMHKIQAQIQLVASGGVTSLAGSGSLSAGLTIGSITGNSSLTGGVGGGGPQHNPTTAPAAAPSGGDLPSRYVR